MVFQTLEKNLKETIQYTDKKEEEINELNQKNEALNYQIEN